MSAALIYERNRATLDDIVRHLHQCAPVFVPPLDTRVDISTYAGKLFYNATRFEARNHGALAGLVACYLNDPQRFVAFISSVSVLAECHGQGIAYTLIEQCIVQARLSGFQCMELEVGRDNAPAIKLYSRIGFSTQAAAGGTIRMHLPL